MQSSARLKTFTSLVFPDLEMQIPESLLRDVAGTERRFYVLLPW